MAAAMGIGRFVYTPILPHMAEQLGLSASATGALATFNFLGYLLGALAAGYIRLPQRRDRALLAVLIANVLMLAAMALTDTFWVHATARLLAGVISAGVIVLSSTLVMEASLRSARPGLVAINFAGVGIGIAASALLIGLMGQAHASWPGLWLASAALAAALSLPTWALVRDEPPAQANAPVAPPPAGTGRGLGLLALSYGLFGFGYVITATFIVAIVRADAALKPVEPLVWIAVGLSIIPSVALWNAIARRIGIPGAYALACLIEAVGVWASVGMPSATGALVAASFLGGTFIGITVMGLSWARQLSPVNPRRAIALMTAAFGFGQLVGPSIAGWLKDMTGSFERPSLMAVAALILAAALAWKQK